MPGDELANMFVRGIIESSLWQHNRHASAGLEKVHIALDKQNVAPNLALGFTI